MRVNGHIYVYVHDNFAHALSVLVRARVWLCGRDAGAQEAERPEWYGTHVRISPVTGKEELYYPRRVKVRHLSLLHTCAPKHRDTDTPWPRRIS
jgi:hypothetical protein